MFTLIDIFLWLIVFLIIASIYWYMTIPKNLPPGPLGLPFIGSALDYLDGRKQHLTVLEQVKKYGPVSKMYIGNRLVIVLGTYEIIYEALVKQGDLFTGRPRMDFFLDEKIRGKGIIMSEGHLWKEQRRFALSTLRDFGVGRPIIEPRIKEEIENLCEAMNEYAASGQEFDPQRLVTCAVSNIISQLLFGHRFGYDDDEFVKQFMALNKRSSGDGISLLSPVAFIPELLPLLSMVPMFQESLREARSFENFTELEMRKTMTTFDPESDPTNYIHAFVKAAANNNDPDSYFTDNQLFATCLDLFQAGTETTSTTTRWAIILLAHHPEVQEKLFEEIKQEVGIGSLPSYSDKVKLPYAEAVVMETQRFANLVPLGFYRILTAPTKLLGYDIPEGSVVLPFLTNILHNPEIYPDPLQFKPERFLDSDGKVIRDPKLIPFQIGKRICLGEPLARMELFLLLVGLASRFRFYFPSGKFRPTLDPVVGFTCTPVPFEICVEARE